MLSFHEIRKSFKKLQIDHRRPLIFHASLSSIGEIQGGADTVLGALLTTVDSLIAPSFTYQTMVIPETGPENNGIDYGNSNDQNRMALFFRPDMPADKSIGILPETLRRHPKSDGRSMHPILSFTGINAKDGLKRQTLKAPLAPIEWLLERHGYVLLIGVDHTNNTSFHLAEQIAGRKNFVRWALTSSGIIECPGFPGCSNGFTEIEPILQKFTRETRIGEASIRLIPLQLMVNEIVEILSENPLALLCEDKECKRCNALRQSVNQ